MLEGGRHHSTYPRYSLNFRLHFSFPTEQSHMHVPAERRHIDREIEDGHPEFLDVQSLSEEQQHLLKIAEDGGPRPERNSATGRVLDGYIEKFKRYPNDLFCRELRKQRPDWFRYGRH
jgi:hypothetical protein